MLTFTVILQGFLVNLVYNIYAHKGEGSILPKHTQDLSCNNSPNKDHFR